MSIFEQFPYTDFHNLNLDWILRRIKEFSAVIADLPNSIADAVDKALDELQLQKIITDIMTDYQMAINVLLPPNNLPTASNDGSADNTVTIQGCIDYAHSVGGGVVFFPAGTYLTGSLILRENVSLVGLSRYNTRLVLRGGVTAPMIYSGQSNNEISGLYIDGNGEVQVNNIDLIALAGSNYLLQNLIVTDGWRNLVINSPGGYSTVTNIVSSRASHCAYSFEGGGIYSVSNIVSNTVTGLDADCSLNISSNDGVYQGVISTAVLPISIRVGGNANSIDARIYNAVTGLLITGVDNTYDIHRWTEYKRLLADYDLYAEHIRFNGVEWASVLDRLSGAETTIAEIQTALSNLTAAVQSNTTAIDYINQHSQFALQSSILTVGKRGAMFTTINAAIDHAKDYCTPLNRVTIQIAPGQYDEEIILYPNPGIDFIGSGAGVTIISAASDYPNATLYTMGSGRFESIGFIQQEKPGSDAYALHVEAQVYSGASEITFIDCAFLSYNNSALGMGLGKDYFVRFRGCRIQAVERPAILAHNLPQGNIPNANQLLVLDGCEIISHNYPHAMYINDACALAGNTNSPMQLQFNANGISPNTISFQASATDFFSYFPLTNPNFTVLPTSGGNNNLALDYRQGDSSSAGILYVSDDGLFSLPCTRADERNFIATSCQNPTGADILATVSFVGTSGQSAVFSTTDAASHGHYVNFNCSITAK